MTLQQYAEFTYKIYYEDTDAQGIMYYGNYLKFFERARTDLLESLHIDQIQLIHQEQSFFVVKKCAIEYFSSVTLGNLVQVQIGLTKLGNSSLVMQENMYYQQTLVTSFECVIVFVQKLPDATLKPRKIPDAIRDKLTLYLTESDSPASTSTSV